MTSNRSNGTTGRVNLKNNQKKSTSAVRPQNAVKLSADETMILGPFLDFAEEGDDALAKYLLHCGVDGDDIRDAGDVQGAILNHYRRPDGKQDIAAAAHDLARWPPIAARIKELKRERRQQAQQSPKQMKIEGR
jgi:hypothetical protein